jgi:hypothetical protein
MTEAFNYDENVRPGSVGISLNRCKEVIFNEKYDLIFFAIQSLIFYEKTRV